MAATILKRQGARNGFSSDLNTNTTADNQVEQKRKWFVAMAKPACVVLHMVHTTRKIWRAWAVMHMVEWQQFART
jgi:hypothetical protein